MEKYPDFLTDFEVYTSIEPSTNTKYEKHITRSKAHLQDVLWVATEKIHGSNFSIIYDFNNNVVKYARRNAFITKEIPVPVEDVTPYFLQNFMDSSDLVNIFHNSLDKVKENISKRYPETIGIQIFGEFFGGYWPGKVESKKRVQLGVYYTPNHEFMVFDIKMYGKKFNTWVEVTEIPEIVEKHLKYVPIYAKGTYAEIQKVNSEFDSTIPELMGLERLKDNICEGLILRPNKNIHHSNRILLKKKNKEFLEKAGFGKNNTPTENKITIEEKNEKVEYLKSFVNANRIESAISKYPDFEDQYHLKGHVIEDVFADVKKESEEKVEELKKHKKIIKTFDRFVLMQIVGYFQNVRTEFLPRVKKTE